MCNKDVFVKDMRAGETYTTYFMVKTAALRPFRQKIGKWLEVGLADATGTINGKMWEGGEAIFPALASGVIVKAKGIVQQYQEALDFVIELIRVYDPERDTINMRDYLPSTPRDIAALWQQVDAAIASIANPALAALVRWFYTDEETRKALELVPGSTRVHHPYLGGTLEQICEALAICNTFRAQWPMLDGDLLTTGALLALMGRTRGYSPFIESTDEGELMGYLTLSNELLAVALLSVEVPPETALRVRHMLVAQHARLEAGSPRRPQTLEALALSLALDASAQLSRYAGIVAGKPEGRNWTERDEVLGRALYAPQPKAQASETAEAPAEGEREPEPDAAQTAPDPEESPAQ